MSGTIYLLNDSKQLVELRESSYNSEALLQELLASYPKLLAGDQMNSDDPRRWLLVRREMPVPDEAAGAGRWSLDHLFLDQEGVPTLIEVKRSSDNRLRREVVGQLLDYAANAMSYWSVERIQAEFEHQCEQDAVKPDKRLAELLDLPEIVDADTLDTSEFWQNVQRNLQAGRLRLVFVADVIPKELRRVIEFLNVQMNPAAVLGVEVKQYVGDGTQDGLKTLVPRVVGQSVAAEQKRRATSNQTPHSTEKSFFETLPDNASKETVAFAKEVLEWSKKNATWIYWGKGSFIPILTVGGEKHHFIYIRDSGQLEFPFQHMKKPFDTIESRQELMNELQPLKTLSAEDYGSKRPKFDMALFTTEESKILFFEVLDKFVEGVRQEHV